MCFVISLANFQMFVSKYELGPSNQSEFFFLILWFSHNVFNACSVSGFRESVLATVVMS